LVCLISKNLLAGSFAEPLDFENDEPPPGNVPCPAAPIPLRPHEGWFRKSSR